MKNIKLSALLAVFIAGVMSVVVGFSGQWISKLSDGSCDARWDSACGFVVTKVPILIGGLAVVALGFWLLSAWLKLISLKQIIFAAVVVASLLIVRDHLVQKEFDRLGQQNAVNTNDAKENHYLNFLIDYAVPSAYLAAGVATAYVPELVKKNTKTRKKSTRRR